MDVPLETLEYSLIEKGLRKRRLLTKLYLEVGCGDGFNLERFSTLGMRGVGIDVSSEAVQLARQKNIQNVKIVEADFMIHALTVSPELIFMLNILEHIEDDCSFLTRAAVLLPQNGFLIIATPTRSDAYGFADLNAGHVRRYEESDLRNKLMGAGFVVEEWLSVGFPINRFYTWAFNTLNRHRLHSTRAQTPFSGIRTKTGYYGGVFDVIAPIAFPILSLLIQIDRLFVHTSFGNNCIVFARKM